MKRLLILVCCLPLFTIAQDKPLIAEGSSPNLYLIHTIEPKENYYSIGRMYNISPKEYAPYNNLTLDKGLALGQKVKIPLTGNFVQIGSPAEGEVYVPVYHIVKDKEGLFHISAIANKLPVATLKKWNHLSGDAVSNGTNLIIGFLKVKKDLSSLASQAVAAPGIDAATTTETTEQVVDIPKPVAPISAPPKKIINKEVAPQPKKEVVQVRPAVSEEPKAETVEAAPVSDKNFKGGVFKSDYNKQVSGQDVSKENGAAAIFKSTSGWDDGKYYCLYNNAQTGTIVKITNAATNKTIYAKVLDLIPDIKQNTGILIRISNAAAEQLGVSDDSKFDCTVEFIK